MATKHKRLSTINPSIKKKWVEALRLRKYKQGLSCLKDDMTNTYCCLGVLATLVDPKQNTWSDNDTYFGGNLVTRGYDNPNSESITAQQKLLGGFIESDALEHLICLNDGGDSPLEEDVVDQRGFKYIATWIEKNL